MAHDRNQTPRRVDQPTPGLFKLRLVRGGPWVAAEIECDALGVWSATIDGERQEPPHPDPALAECVFRIWHYGQETDASEHAFLVERARWARIHAPDSPEANPTRAIRIGSLPPAF
jgi:hypothetical protein